MELVEVAAMRMQHQRPAGAQHHAREDQLAQRAAARREVDVHDGRLDALERTAQSCARPARTSRRARSSSPRSMVGDVAHRDVRREVVADVLLDRRDAAAHVERRPELQHLDAARRERRAPALRGASIGAGCSVEPAVGIGSHSAVPGRVSCRFSAEQRTIAATMAATEKRVSARRRAASPICWRLRWSAYSAAISAGSRAASSVGDTT